MRIRLMLVLLAILLILSLVFLSACAPTAASSTEPTETALPADLPVMTKIWITPECYQAHPENAVYNAQGDRLCTDGATMEVLEAEATSGYQTTAFCPDRRERLGQRAVRTAVFPLECGVHFRDGGNPCNGKRGPGGWRRYVL